MAGRKRGLNDNEVSDLMDEMAMDTGSEDDMLDEEDSESEDDVEVRDVLVGLEHNQLLKMEELLEHNQLLKVEELLEHNQLLKMEEVSIEE